MSFRGWVGLLSLIVMFPGCSSSLGSGNSDLPKEGVTSAVACADPLDSRPVSACPGLVRVGVVSALDVLDLLAPAALAAYGPSAGWTGWIRGVGIAADGTLAASGTSGFTTAWCDGENELMFDTTAGECAVRNACDCVAQGDCRGPCEASAVQQPAVDSPAAIAAAFPGADVSDTFDVVFDSAVGNWWSVRRTGTVQWTQVDAASGIAL